MPTFWAGAGAALVGAVVGGIFTTLAARIQARSSLHAINYELQQTFAYERGQRRNELAREASTRLIDSFSTLLTILDEIFERHKDCRGASQPCPRDSLPIRKLETWRRFYDRLDALYGYSQLPHLRDIEVSGVADLVDAITAWKTAAQLDKPLLEAALKNASKLPYLGEGVCNYRAVANYATFQVMDLSEEVRKASEDLT